MESFAYSYSVSSGEDLKPRTRVVTQYAMLVTANVESASSMSRISRDSVQERAAKMEQKIIFYFPSSNSVIPRTHRLAYIAGRTILAHRFHLRLCWELEVHNHQEPSGGFFLVPTSSSGFIYRSATET